LMFAYEDDYGGHSNNNGYFTVAVTVTPGPTTPTVTVTMPTVVTQTVQIAQPVDPTAISIFAAAVIVAVGLVVATRKRR
jgi:hypothetical protein